MSPRLLPRLLLLLLALTWSSGAEAIRILSRPATCPLDQTRVKLNELQVSNVSGGHDSDLCAYASEGQWREYALVSCPADLLTLYAPDFLARHDARTLASFRAVSREILPRYPDLDRVEPWDRYEIAVAFYRVLGKDSAFLGDLYLTASWLARDRAVGFMAGIGGPEAALALLEGGALELQKELEIPKRKTLLYNLARVAERYGDPALRDRYLATFELAGPLDEAEGLALTRFRAVVHEVEPRYQDLAFAEYRAFLASGGGSNAEKARVRYLLADLHRRRGRLAEAAPLFGSVADDTAAPDDLRALARFLHGRTARGLP